jgi:spore coat protein U-like protein
MKRFLSRLLPVVAGMLFAGAASAQTANIAVTASVAANCRMTVTAVAFGAYDPLVTNLAADLHSDTGSVSVSCTKRSNYTVSFDKAAGSMAGVPSGSLTYTLSGIADHSAPLGIFATNNVPNRTPIVHSIYGLVPANQEADVGAYSDTVVATLNFN